MSHEVQEPMLAAEADDKKATARARGLRAAMAAAGAVALRHHATIARVALVAAAAAALTGCFEEYNMEGPPAPPRMKRRS